MIRMLLFTVISLSIGITNLQAQKENIIGGSFLLGVNSVPPVTSSATGTLTGVLTNDWTEFQYTITIEGLTPTVAHFHNGAFDATGGVVKTLDFSGGSTISGVWSASDIDQPFTAEMLNELLAGRIYANVHTADNSGGEIRGNIQFIVPMKVILSGDKIVPTPITSSGVGTAYVLIVGSDREVIYGLNITGITPTNSHFHGASATETGGVLKGITLVNDFAEGEWTGTDTSQALSDSLFDEFLLENVYMNIHTAANPGGEIRGQVELVDAASFFAIINGDNQVPMNSSIGSGTAVFEVNSDRTQIEYDITISQITPTVAHIHNAGTLISGGVVKDLDFVDGHASGIWSSSDGTQPLTSLLVEELFSGRLYVNVHTSTYPSGEIRGQIIVISGYNAELDGSQTVPAVASSGTGTFTGTFFYSNDGAELEYNITVEGLTITNAHFHSGAAGETGAVLKTIAFDGNSAVGIWTAFDDQPFTDEIVDLMRSGGVYVNIHTAAYSSGEIRGQLLPNLLQFPIGVQDTRILQQPVSFALKQNYPNPFNPTTLIEYELKKNNPVLLTIHNLLGEEVARLVDKQQNVGSHKIEWDASAMSSGIYFYKLQAGKLSRTKKMVLLK